MFDRASLKLGLDKAVLQSMGTKELNTVSIILEDSSTVLSVSAIEILTSIDGFNFVSNCIYLFFFCYSLIS
jgi:hypothetical protein